jgi:hypothetical protein
MALPAFLPPRLSMRPLFPSVCPFPFSVLIVKPDGFTRSAPYLSLSPYFLYAAVFSFRSGHMPAPAIRQRQQNEARRESSLSTPRRAWGLVENR